MDKWTHSTEDGGKSKALLIEFHSTTLLPSNTENPASSPVLLSDGPVSINCQACTTGNFPLLWCNRESRQKSNTWLHRGKTESVSEELAHCFHNSDTVGLDYTMLQSNLKEHLGILDFRLLVFVTKQFYFICAPPSNGCCYWFTL